MKTTTEAAARLSSFKVTAFHPFDPVAKRTEATVEDTKGNEFKVSRGAPQVILSLVASKELVEAAVDEKVNAFATMGYRALGVARSSFTNW